MMSLRKTWAVLVKETRHILRDPATLILLLLAPPALLVIMSYGLVADIRETPISVLDASRSPLSRQFLATLANSRDVVVKHIVANYAEAERLFYRSQTKALVVIPPKFAEQLTAGHPAEIQVIVDGTDPTTADHVITHVLSRSQMFGVNAAVKTIGRAQSLPSPAPPIDFRVRTWYNPDLKNGPGIVPAMIAMVMSLPAIVVMNAIVREKEHGTLEGIFATPLKRSELLIGKLIPYTLLGLVSVVLCVLVGIALFEVPFRGDFGLFLALSTLFLLALYSMGIFLATFLSNQAASSLLGLLIFMFPSFFLSGMFYPVSSFPDVVQEESGFLPTTHFVTIARGLMVKGQGVSALVYPVAMLAVLTVLMTGLSIFFFNKKLR
ncbi:MAG: putative multidrug ABC transporter permease YbhS [Anaerolineae bacterium]|nr:putative multidrug ABC transporter permease YbhS [Anaerolineae bacterium]